MSSGNIERPAVIALPADAPDGASALEGLSLEPDEEARGGAVIAAPHPLYGGSMESPVVGELSSACGRSGLFSLRFNWRGVGASGGTVSGEGEIADADYASALSFVEESVEGPIVAAGYSFGAATAVRSAEGRPRIRRFLLVAPPPIMLADDALRSLPGPVLVIAAENDHIAPPSEIEGMLSGAEKAQLEVVPDADHFFMTGMSAISRYAREWLSGSS